jgi:hypothetical protein
MSQPRPLSNWCAISTLLLTSFGQSPPLVSKKSKNSGQGKRLERRSQEKEALHVTMTMTRVTGEGSPLLKPGYRQSNGIVPDGN